MSENYVKCGNEIFSFSLTQLSQVNQSVIKTSMTVCSQKKSCLLQNTTRTINTNKNGKKMFLITTMGSSGVSQMCDRGSNQIDLLISKKSKPQYFKYIIFYFSRSKKVVPVWSFWGFSSYWICDVRSLLNAGQSCACLPACPCAPACAGWWPRRVCWVARPGSRAGRLAGQAKIWSWQSPTGFS